jgi:hypothetical protein
MVDGSFARMRDGNLGVSCEPFLSASMASYWAQKGINVSIIPLILNYGHIRFSKIFALRGNDGTA